MDSIPGLDAFSLAGKTALVTGARQGNGQAIAVGLARAGARVVLWDVRDADETASRIEAMGLLGGVVLGDLSDWDVLDAECAKLTARQPIDILVNNAGIIRRSPAIAYPDIDWTSVLDVNLTAVFRLTRTVGRAMVERGAGKVINICSLLSFQGGINAVGYTATKHAIAGVTKALANEWGGQGVQVNAIAPGYIRTANTQPLVEDPDRYQAILERIPAGRWGDPVDLIGAAVFLSSRASDYVNGHVLVVDGGWMAR